MQANAKPLSNKSHKNSLPSRRQGSLSCCAKAFRRYERLCLSRSYLAETTLSLIRFPLSGSFIFYRYRRIYLRIRGRTSAGSSDPPAPSRIYRSGRAVRPRVFWRRSSGRIFPYSKCRRCRSSPRNPPAWESRIRGRICRWP